MEEEILFFQNSLEHILNTSPPSSPHFSSPLSLQTKEIFGHFKKRKEIKLNYNDFTCRYCLPLFQVHLIPPIQNNSSSISSTQHGVRKSYKQSYQELSKGLLLMETMLLLLNTCYSYGDKHNLTNEMKEFLLNDLNVHRNPLDYMVHVMYSSLFLSNPTRDLKDQTFDDSDEEFEIAIKALTTISLPTLNLSQTEVTSDHEDMTPTTSTQILQMLKVAPHPLKAHSISKELGINKSEVNRCLYKVLSDQVVHHCNHTWSIRQNSQLSPTDRSDSSNLIPAVENDVINYLASSSPCNAKTIRRDLNIARTKIVNQILYGLLHQNRVQKSRDEPPLWSLCTS